MTNESNRRFPIGPHLSSVGNLEFCVWAPKADKMELIILQSDGKIRHPMAPTRDGYYECILNEFDGDLEYFFAINGNAIRPDPASRWQPKGVHGPSKLYLENSYLWHDQSWKGISLDKYLIYELHVGTFTQEGTFEAIIEKLPYLISLGVTAIELMPIAEFPGERNWGYDGVYSFAPHHSYGGPHALKNLINACHLAGLAVIIDVVYNHLGPEGNYLGEFGYYYTDAYNTPWGNAINFDGPYSDPVRHYFIENALYWLKEFHVDALRIDAIHAMYDFSAKHFLEELQEVFHTRASVLGREAHLIVESDLNDVRILNPRDKGGYAIDAQWNDDFHHAMHTLLTKSNWKYFQDYGEISDIAHALTKGFVYEGQRSLYRKKRFGSPSGHLQGDRFVVCTQNHDQIGNACQGERLNSLVSSEKCLLAASVLTCSPFLPLLFMGQEWGATSPFYYFTSFEDGNLAKAVKQGYSKDHHLSDANFDPQDPKNFLDSKLRWEEVKQPCHEAILRYYQTLIRVRKAYACLSNCRKDLTESYFNEEGEWMAVIRKDSVGPWAILAVNFAEKYQNIDIPFSSGEWRLIFSSVDKAASMAPFTIYATHQDFQSIPMQPWEACLYVQEVAPGKSRR